MQQVLGFYSYEIRSHPVFSSRTTAYPSATSQPESSTIREEDLIKKSEVLDPLEEDDDDIEWKHNSFDIHHVSEPGETPAELIAKITFEGHLLGDTQRRNRRRLGSKWMHYWS